MPLLSRDFTTAAASRLPEPVRRQLGSPTGKRMIRFAPAAVVALAATQITYFLGGSVLHLTGRVTGAAGWLAGAAVSYVVSRWAWQRRGRPRLLQETLPFLAISIAAGSVLIEASHLGYQEAGSLGLHGLAFYAFAQACYLAANCVTFVVRFVIFNLVVFADRRPDFGEWYRRCRGLIPETGKFGLVGLAGLVVTDGGANLLHYRAGMGGVAALAAATVVATVVTFVGNRYWTYRDRERSGLARETALFFAVNAAGIGISEVPVVAGHLLGLDSGLYYNAAVLTGIALATLLRYWAYRAWIWRAAPDSAAPAPASALVPVPAAMAVAMESVPSGEVVDAGRAVAGRWRGSLRRLAAGFGGLLPELARFAAVGVCTLLIYSLMFGLLLVQARVALLPALAAAGLLATAVSFAGNRQWTFRHRQRTTLRREGLRYLLLTCAVLLLQAACVRLGILLHLRGGGVLIVVNGLSLLGRFWVCRAWVWRPRQAACV